MIVSDSHEFVFAHIPKTGGTSVAIALEPFADGQSVAHSDTAHETLAEFLERHPEKSGHFTFAFVRNPWERAVSFYFHARKRLTRTIPQMKEIATFEDLLRLLDKGADWLCGLVSLRPQCEFVRDRKGGLLTNFLGRYERIDEDFRIACRRAGVTAALPTKNLSDHAHYANYYSDWGKGFIAAHYREDVNEFGYTFEAAS